MAIESAGKHGVSREDAIWAMTHPRYVKQELDEPRPPSRVRPMLFMRPSRTPAVPLLEVIVELVPPDRTVVLHVMAAREKHVHRATDG